MDFSELESTVRKLRALDEDRLQRVQYRDRQLVEALAAGATWKQLEAVTGLSPRGLALAIRRNKG